MSSKNRKFLVVIQSVLFLVFSKVVAFAQQTTDLDQEPYTSNGVLTIQGIERIIANILNIAISGIGFAGFVMLIVGSYQYLLSGGNSKGVEGGKNTMTYAIVGLVVALSSFIILNFISAFTGVSAIKTFNLCFGETC